MDLDFWEDYIENKNGFCTNSSLVSFGGRFLMFLARIRRLYVFGFGFVARSELDRDLGSRCDPPRLDESLGGVMWFLIHLDSCYSWCSIGFLGPKWSEFLMVVDLESRPNSPLRGLFGSRAPWS